MTYHSRFEYKYIVPKQSARLIERELREFMRLDPWLLKAKVDSYIVSSLYLDSPNLTCYESVEQGERNRFKLRVRWYGNDISEPVFLEEKARHSDAISKARVAISIEAAQELMRGMTLTHKGVLGKGPKDRATASRLLEKIRSYKAQRSCVVRYKRQAWEGIRDRSVRVTFDQNLEAVTCGNNLDCGNSVDSNGIIFEVKFQTQVPEWLASIIQRHGLVRCSVPKYVMCVDKLNEPPRLQNNQKRFSHSKGGIR